MAFKAKELLNEFLNVQRKPLRDMQPRSLVRWNPLSEGMYKANFDGVIFSELSLVGIGVVIHDSYRNVIVALSQKIPLPQSVDLVEALASSRAVSFARELCISMVEFEGDSQRIVTAINNETPPKTMFGHVIEEIWILSEAFHKYSFKQVKREGNRLVHSLARRAILFVDLD